MPKKPTKPQAKRSQRSRPAKGKRPTRKIHLRPKQMRAQEPGKDGTPQWRRAWRTSLLWLVIGLGAVILVQSLALDRNVAVEITFSEYQQLLESDAIKNATVIENEFVGELHTPVALQPRLTERNGVIVRVDSVVIDSKFRFILPDNYVDENVLARWDSHGMTYNFKEKTLDWLGYIIQMSPWILIFAFWIFMMRRVQGGGARGIFSFGKSRARVLTGKEPRVTFNDVAGVEEAKQELSEIIDYLKDPEKFQRLGGRIPKGVLLLGPPGTGKTLLAKAVAGEAEVPFFSMSGADFVEMFVGVGASRVRDLFEQGKKNAPCIIFIDELDAVGRTRGAGLGGGHDEREQTLNQLLVEMDGFETNEGVILLAATNRPDVLDTALLRPGRFDRQVVVDNPDVRGRKGIFEVHTRELTLADDVDLEVLARGTPGLSGADLANLVNEAALLAARRDKEGVEMSDFEDAKDKVMMGVERKSLIISERDRRITAYHEAGHALVAKLLPEADPIHKVTIVPRGRALGTTHQLPIDEKHNYSKDFVRTQLVILLGGRSAEQIVFKVVTTGGGNDIERATEIARKMVCDWGMSERLGPLTFGKKNEEIFLGREIATHRDYSERTAQIIDEEVQQIVMGAERESRQLLEGCIDTLHTLAERLLEKEILDGEEIDRIVKQLAGKTPGDGATGDKPKDGRTRRQKARRSSPSKATPAEVS